MKPKRAIVVRTATRKPRNPIALAARQRSAGPHTDGNQRQRARQALERSLRDGRGED